MTTSLLTRAGFAGVLTLSCAGLTGLATAAPAHAATPDGTTAGYFLQSQLAASGDHFVSSGYPDYGLTIDGVLGLDTLQAGQTEAAKAAAYVVKNADNYNKYGDDVYSASTAKLLVFTEAQGLPTAETVKQLQSLRQSNGEFADTDTSTGKPLSPNYANTLGQSFAIIGLVRAEQPDATAADFLAKQQCSDGGFRVSFTGACTGDPDATSFAVQALVAAGGHDAAVTKAVNFLAGKQQANGGVVEPAAQPAPNTNSTGLAAVAFALAGKTAAANRAKSFVQSLQFGCDAPAALQGGIAYDRATFDSLTKQGGKAVASATEDRATTQGLFAFTQQPYLTITAGGAATAPALSCATASPTSTTSPTSTATSTTATSTTTGPPIVTDGPQPGGNRGVLFGGAALLGGAALAGAGLRRRMRSNS